MPEEYKDLIRQIAEKKGLFSRGIIGTPFNKLIDSIRYQYPAVDFKLLYSCLKKAGWIDKKRVNCRDFTNKKHIFLSPDFAGLSGSNARRFLESGLDSPPEIYLSQNDAEIGRLTLQESFQRILSRYARISSTMQFGSDNEVARIFDRISSLINYSNTLREFPNITVIAYYGEDNWAVEPMIILLDNRITNSIKLGVYISYKFILDSETLCLEISQNLIDDEHLTKIAEENYTASKIDFLKHSTEIIRKEYFSDLPCDNVNTAGNDLISENSNGPDIKYLSSIAQKFYIKNQLPTDEALMSDLGEFIRHYDEYAQDMGSESLIADKSEKYDLVDDSNKGLSKPAFFEKLKSLIERQGLDPEKTAAQLGVPKYILRQWLTGLRQSNASAIRMQEEISSHETSIKALPTGPLIDQAIIKRKPAPQALNIQWLIDRTGLSKDFLAELTDSAMGSSPQIMLSGPPGTGKTWLARLVALYITRNRPENIRFVQFHPSYSYESFIEGLRPISTDSGISFELTAGVVKELVNEMKIIGDIGSKDNNYVIVIDEANRANLPRVLGELMFLFEYRDQNIQLQYSRDFALPSNLCFIGTMNTADRSIRNIDAALRRRFDVFEIQPNEDILSNHYSNGAISVVPDLVDGFLKLNAALELKIDRHHRIGHTFFMRDYLDNRMINKIWTRKIYPLIEEYFFDQDDLVKEFTLERFWPSVGNAS